MSRGALIVFEGLDRSGKSTQAKLLRDHIRKSGRDAEIIRFPGMSLYLSNVPFFYLFLIHFLLNKWDLYRNITCLLVSKHFIFCSRRIGGKSSENWSRSRRFKLIGNNS
uniref:Thymidylate_kin domain-containing protein n=1 Tax=Heterorhabditis bacteriophora TaxID=37862 RepID=A0A1I7WBR0_HETBA